MFQVAMTKMGSEESSAGHAAVPRRAVRGTGVASEKQGKREASQKAAFGTAHVHVRPLLTARSKLSRIAADGLAFEEIHDPRFE
jgi:hypothetical protein